jgi:hypothetical protein
MGRPGVASAAGALLATLLGAGSGELVAAGGTGSALAVQSVKRSSGLGPVSWVLRAREQTVLWPVAEQLLQPGA